MRLEEGSRLPPGAAAAPAAAATAPSRRRCCPLASCRRRQALQPARLSSRQALAMPRRAPAVQPGTAPAPGAHRFPWWQHRQRLRMWRPTLLRRKPRQRSRRRHLAPPGSRNSSSSSSSSRRPAPHTLRTPPTLTARLRSAMASGAAAPAPLPGPTPRPPLEALRSPQPQQRRRCQGKAWAAAAAAAGRAARSWSRHVRRPARLAVWGSSGHAARTTLPSMTATLAAHLPRQAQRCSGRRPMPAAQRLAAGRGLLPRRPAAAALRLLATVAAAQARLPRLLRLT